jgi:hypothetical protein
VNDVPETPHQQPVATRGGDSRTIAVTCSQQGAVGFTTLIVSKLDGAIGLDPHVAGSCVITLDETAATALSICSASAQMSARSSLTLRGGPADPHQVCPNRVEGTL